MKLTKQQLKKFLTEHPAITKRSLSLEAGLNENYINQLYNGSKRNLTNKAADKIYNVLVKYGFVW